MRDPRTIWQALAALLRIAVLVAFVLPGIGHAHSRAHAGASRLGHTHSVADRILAKAASASVAQAGHADHLAHGGMGSTELAPAELAPAEDGVAPGHACPSSCPCGCHPVFGMPADAAPAPRRLRARTRPPVSDPAFVSLTPEALPEPPRPLA